eukprot:gene14537-16687_t
MTSAVEGDIEDWYENRVRDRLPIYLAKALGISVYEPTSGYNQSYKKKSFESVFGVWPLTKPTEDAELDFVGHSRDVKTFPQSGTDFIFDKQVILTLSACTVADNNPPLTTKFTSPTVTPSKDNPPPLHECAKYVLAEITAGGSKSVKKKVHQLETGITVIMAKARHTATNPTLSVLNVVLLAIVACTKPLWSVIVNRIQMMANGVNTYPNLLELYNAGRFALVYDGNSISTVVRLTEASLQSIADNVQILTSDVTVANSDVLNLTSVVNDFSTQLDAFSKKLDGISEGQQSTSRIAMLSNQIQNGTNFGYSPQELEALKLELRTLVLAPQAKK